MLRKALFTIFVILVGVLAGGATYKIKSAKTITKTATTSTPESTLITATDSSSYLNTSQKINAAKEKIIISKATKNEVDGSLTGTLSNTDNAERTVNLKATYYNQDHTIQASGYSSLITLEPNSKKDFSIYPIENTDSAPSAPDYTVQIISIN